MTAYTEEEAKTKWCPFIRFSGAGTATDFEFATNRGDEYGEHSFSCVASECMAWRWVPEVHTKGRRADAYPKPGQYAKTEGYCGLAATNDKEQ